MITTFNDALQIIQNCKGITEAQLMARKAAYIAERLAINREWQTIAIVTFLVFLTSAILVSVFCEDNEGLYEGLWVATAATFIVGLLVVIGTTQAISAWTNQPDVTYADYILQIARNCLD